jgi:hypothetical protein
MCKRATFAQVMGILALIAEFENDISYRAVCRERSGPTQRRSHRCVINAVRETLLRYWFDAEVCDVGLRRWSIELKHAYWGQLASVHYSRLFQWRKGLRWQSLRVIDLSVVEAATHRQQRGENRQSGDHTHHLTPSYATNVSSNIQPYFLARVVAEKPQRPRTFSDPRYRRATEIHHSLTISECYRRAVPNQRTPYVHGKIRLNLRRTDRWLHTGLWRASSAQDSERRSKWELRTYSRHYQPGFRRYDASMGSGCVGPGGTASVTACRTGLHGSDH